MRSVRCLRHTYIEPRMDVIHAQMLLDVVRTALGVRAKKKTNPSINVTGDIRAALCAYIFKCLKVTRE